MGVSMGTTEKPPTEHSLRIEERKLSKHIIRKKKGKKIVAEYLQYRLTLPKSFGDEHTTDKVYIIADSVGMFMPDKDTLLKILAVYPEIRSLVVRGDKDNLLTQMFELWNTLSDSKKLEVLEILNTKIKEIKI